MNVAIAGAGIMGRLVAFYLLQGDHDVTLFAGENETSCSQAAAGLLTPVAELEKNELIIFKLGEAALNCHWGEVLTQLDTPIYFEKKGSLILSHANDKSELTRLMRFISHRLQDDQYYQCVNQREISALEPALSHFEEGYYFPTEGQLDSQAVLIALKQYLVKKDVNWLCHSFTPHQASRFDLVIDCRGLSAKSMFKDLRGIRGELIWLHAKELTLRRPIRLMHPRYSLYIAPRPHQIYVVGASEIESEDDSPISVRTTLELLSAAYCLHPSFCEARIVKTVAHCRPTLTNHLPSIKYTENIIAVNGLYRHGFLIAPTLAYEVAQGIEKGPAGWRYPTLWEKAT